MICHWREDRSCGFWETECQNAFNFETGTPTSNDFKFCPYCGKELKEITDDYQGD